MTDSDLLRQFVVERREDAFTALVAQRFDVVYAAALRQIGGDAHRARDIVQEVFIQLARKAPALVRHPSLLGWLYTTTHYTAVSVIRREQRRQRREEEAHAMETISAETDGAWDRLRPVLDEAMHELGERDRRIVLLRFFAQQSLSSIGAELGITENAAQKTVERALDRFRTVLAKRHITSTSAALAAALANQAVGQAPVGMAASIAGNALSGAAASATGAAGGAGSLAALWYFIGGSKVGVYLGTAVVLAGAATIYQTNRAIAANETLTRTQRDHVALIARRAELQARADAAEQRKVDRQLALERTRLVRANAAAAARKAEEAQRVKQAEALQQLLFADPEWRQLHFEASRAAIMTDLSLGPQRLTRDQLEQKANALAQRPDLQTELVNARLNNGPGGIRVTPNWDASLIIREVSNALFYADEPFTRSQVTQLEAILLAAKTSDNLSRYGNFNWDFALSRAESILSPTQLRGLRSIAARGRVIQMQAAAMKATP